MDFAPLPAAKFTRARALLQKKMRDKYGEFVLEGARLAQEAVQSAWNVRFLCVAEHTAARFSREFSHTPEIPVYSLPDDQFAELSAVEHSQGVLAVVEKKTYPPLDTLLDELRGAGRQIILALDRISDPGNVGTIIRSADWFGAAAVLLGEGCADCYNPKTVRATMGSLFRVPVIETSDLAGAVADVRGRRYAVYALDASGEPLGAGIALAEKSVLIVGSEAEGISEALRAGADATIAIQKYGGGESLNAAMAATAALALVRG